MEHCRATSTEVLDRAGMSASLACAMHCAILPLVLMALPALGLAWFGSAWIDGTMVLLAAAIAIRAHRRGIALHRRCLPVGVALMGLLLIMIAICALKGSATGHYLQGSGAMMVAGSHWLNRQLCRRCPACRGQT
jgi:MerC mercury resistance protein